MNILSTSTAGFRLLCFHLVLSLLLFSHTGQCMRPPVPPPGGIPHDESRPLAAAAGLGTPGGPMALRPGGPMAPPAGARAPPPGVGQVIPHRPPSEPQREMAAYKPRTPSPHSTPPQMRTYGGYPGYHDTSGVLHLRTENGIFPVTSWNEGADFAMDLDARQNKGFE